MATLAPAPAATVAAKKHGLGAAFIFKKALISALVALVLFSLMIGVRTEAGPEGQLIYWTRFGDLGAMVATVFVGSIVIELLRQWWGHLKGMVSPFIILVVNSFLITLPGRPTGLLIIAISSFLADR